MAVLVQKNYSTANPSAAAVAPCKTIIFPPTAQGIDGELKLTVCE
jgi:hypothetical protein